MRRLFRLFSLLAIGLLWAGCSGEPTLEDLESGEERSFGLLAVTYSHDLTAESGDDLDLTTTAQFVRYTSMKQSQVARLLALPLDPEKELPSTGQCKLYDLTIDLSEEVIADGAEMSNVELLEAGDLVLETSAGKVTLVPRHFPGLLPFISGVVYGEAQADRAEQVGKVRARSEGSEAIGAFQVEAESPALPGIDQPASSWSPGDDLTISWRPANAAGGWTYLELSYSASKRNLVLRCNVEDDGRFRVPARRLEELAGASSSGKLGLDLVRLRRAFFSASGLDQGELRISVRQQHSLQIR